ncbi:hypothetical protein [Paraflavitalea pollutisoli]|uniref:hypothetical protein n=1 Tax=Paraflavitalea pollutisoli TaxID=3034143 RepID=UPI0023EE1639|nr:hypothetical protein [Paraflavitalea sp. H1-2-19X]
MEYGQKLNPKDVKTQPQEEFINQTNHKMDEAAEETPVIAGAAQPENLPAQEIEEEGWELDERADQKAAKDLPYPPKAPNK